MNLNIFDPKTYAQFVTILPAGEYVLVKFCLGNTCEQVNVTSQTDFNLNLGGGNVKVGNTFSVGCKLSGNVVLYSGLLYSEYTRYGDAGPGTLGDVAGRDFSNISSVPNTVYIQQPSDLYVNDAMVRHHQTTSDDGAKNSFEQYKSGFRNFLENIKSSQLQPLTGGSLGNVYYTSSGIAQNTVFEDSTSGSVLQFTFSLPNHTFIVSNKIPKLTNFSLSFSGDCQYAVKILELTADVFCDVAATLSYTCDPSCLDGIAVVGVGQTRFKIPYMPRGPSDNILVKIVADGTNQASTGLKCTAPTSFAGITTVYGEHTSSDDGYGNPFGFLSDIRFQLGIGIGLGSLLLIGCAVAAYCIYQKSASKNMSKFIKTSNSSKNSKYFNTCQSGFMIDSDTDDGLGTATLD